MHTRTRRQVHQPDLRSSSSRSQNTVRLRHAAHAHIVDGLLHAEFKRFNDFSRRQIPDGHFPVGATGKKHAVVVGIPGHGV